MKRILLTAFTLFLTGIISYNGTGIPAGIKSAGPENYVVQDTLNNVPPIKMVRFNLDIIPPSKGIQFYKNGIVFLSHTKVEDRMISDHVSFGTLGTYYTNHTDTIQRENYVFSHNDPFAVPTESMTFNHDYTLMFYAKRTRGNDPEKIYQADYETGRGGRSEWVSHKKPLDFCDDNSTYTHPALSQSGDMLVFASNRRGSSGGLDLYLTHKTGNSWSSPENLGKYINTPGNELFPFLDNENNLYFSSDGHKGIGGYDLYFSKYNGKYWDKPVNLTGAVNTTADELAFRINPVDPTVAFLSVRQESDNASLKLYKITFADKYSLKRFSDISRAMRNIAGADIAPFITTGEESTEVKQTDQLQAKTQKPDQAPEKKDQVVAPEAGKEAGAAIAKLPEKIQDETEKPVPPAVVSDIAANQPLPDDLIVFRVQFLSSVKSRGSFDVQIGGKSYKSFEYFYNGSYRSCAGEFGSLNEARDFQKIMNREKYPEAFVVAFKNNERITDLRSVTSTRTTAESGQKPITAVPAETDYRPGEPAADVAAGQKLTQPGIENVVYRIQLSSYSEPRNPQNITIGGITYKSFEYFYNGLYRLCAGEFESNARAREALKTIKQEGYADAFVVAFKNNQRSLDPSLFR